VKTPQIKPQQFEQQRLLTAPLEDGHQATGADRIGRGSTYILKNGSSGLWESSIIDYTKAVQSAREKPHRRHPQETPACLLSEKQAAEKRLGTAAALN